MINEATLTKTQQESMSGLMIRVSKLLIRVHNVKGNEWMDSASDLDMLMRLSASCVAMMTRDMTPAQRTEWMGIVIMGQLQVYCAQTLALLHGHTTATIDAFKAANPGTDIQ